MSFVLVLWLEPQEEAADPVWRWRVIWTPTGERAYFSQVADLLAFVSLKTGAPPPQ